MTYEIGYRRPPESGKFAKGKSGNPKGRPKGSKNFATLLEKELNETIMVNENGRRKKISRMQAMVKRLVTGGLQGDQKSLLSLIAVMHRTGQLSVAGEPESLLPPDYEQQLENYVKKQQSTTS